MRWSVGFAAVVLLVGLVGCHGGMHQKGDQQITFMGSYGEPFNEGFVWNGADGTGQNGAFTVGYNYFLDDRIALMINGTPYRIYNQSDGDIYAGEFQMGFRYYFFEFDLLEKPLGLYAEMLGGLTYGSNSIPEEGSNFNFTHDTGAGFEWQLSDNVSWISGYRLKHLSNGNFFNDDNPSQNEHHVYTGLAVSW